jgi:hypothetical protein
VSLPFEDLVAEVIPSRREIYDELTLDNLSDLGD